MPGYTRVVYVMAYRQLKRFIRLRSRIIGSIINPLVWLVFFGLGWSNVFSGVIARQIFYGLDYISYLTPGIIMMTVFTASFTSGLTVIWDKELGFMKELLVAPASRTASIIGRALGDAITAMLQGLLILVAAYPLAENLRIDGMPMVILGGFLVALAFTSLGIAIASKMRSMEGFHLIMSFLMLPLIFISGAFYPIEALPRWMQILAEMNPMTYGVDLARYSLTGVTSMSLSMDLVALILSSAIMLGGAAYVFRKATIE